MQNFFPTVYLPNLKQIRIFSHSCKYSLKGLRLFFLHNTNLPQKGWSKRIITRNLAHSVPSMFQEVWQISETKPYYEFTDISNFRNTIASPSPDKPQIAEIKQFCMILTILIMRTLSKTQRGTSGYKNLAWHWISGLEIKEMGDGKSKGITWQVWRLP